MKAVLHYRAGHRFRRRLAALDSDWFRSVVVEEADKEAFRREMEDADVLLHVLERVTSEAIDAAHRLRLIQKIGVGVNTIDLDAARRRGIAVCNMPGTNTQAVAEMTVLLMLATLRRLAELGPMTRSGAGWTIDPASLDNLAELSGRTVGLLGFGAVARRVATIVHAFGAEAIYTARNPVMDAPFRRLPLDEMLAAADIVSLHVPLTQETERIVDAAALARTKPGAILVNTARGGLVDEPAVLRALDSGRLRGVGTDVFSLEPVPPDHPFLARRDVVVTPHLAWLTEETLERSLAVIAENCRRLRDSEELLHRVA